MATECGVGPVNSRVRRVRVIIIWTEMESVKTNNAAFVVLEKNKHLTVSEYKNKCVCKVSLKGLTIRNFCLILNFRIVFLKS